MQDAESDNTARSQEAGASLRARRPRLAGLVIGAVAFLGLFALILHIGDVGAFVDAIAKTDPLWLLPALVAQALAFFVQASVWGLVLSRRNQTVRRSDLFTLSIGKLFADQAIPSAGVSGAVFFLHALSRRGVTGADAFATFVFGATTFILAFIIFAAGALTFLALSGGSPGDLRVDIADVYYVAIGVALLFLLVIAIAAATRSNGAKEASALSRSLETLIKAFRIIWRERGIFLSCLALQSLGRLLDAVTLWIAFQAQGGGVPFPASVAAVSLAALAATIAPTPMGLGSFEAGLLAALAALGHGVEASFAASLIYRGLSLGLPLALGFFVVQRELLKK